MDKTEALADMVIEAVQFYLEKKIAPLLAALAEVRADMTLMGAVTTGELGELRNRLQSLDVPTRDQIKTEASAAALSACTELFKALPKPADGKDAQPEAVAAEVTRQIALVPPPKDGQSIDLGAIFAEIGTAVTRAVDALPKPADGKAGRDGVDGVGKDGRDGINGKDGRDVDMEQVRRMITANIPAPVEGPPGKDAVIDMAEVRRDIGFEVARTLATWDKPKDGRDGADGLGFDDLSAHLMDDGRTTVFRFSNGTRERELSVVFPCQIYRGQWEPKRSYQRGDVVTYAGSQYTAKCETDKPPRTDDWLCSVKRGKDGHA